MEQEHAGSRGTHGPLQGTGRRQTANGEELDRLAATLDLLAGDAVRVLEQRPGQASAIRQMAEHVTEIRKMLQELASLPNNAGDGGLSAENSRRLGTRYLDLEGRVKELRNDLSATR